MKKPFSKKHALIALSSFLLGVASTISAMEDKLHPLKIDSATYQAFRKVIEQDIVANYQNFIAKNPQLREVNRSVYVQGQHYSTKPTRALILTLRFASYNIFTHLVKNGADINKRDEDIGLTPIQIHYNASKLTNQAPRIESLFLKGGAANAENIEGGIQDAAYMNDKPTFNLLVGSYPHNEIIQHAVKVDRHYPSSPKRKDALNLILKKRNIICSIAKAKTGLLALTTLSSVKLPSEMSHEIFKYMIPFDQFQETLNISQNDLLFLSAADIHKKVLPGYSFRCQPPPITKPAIIALKEKIPLPKTTQISRGTPLNLMYRCALKNRGLGLFWQSNPRLLLTYKPKTLLLQDSTKEPYTEKKKFSEWQHFTRTPLVLRSALKHRGTISDFL